MYNSQYSRQCYALDNINLPNKNILVSNMSPITSDIIKLLLVQGHKNITLHDPLNQIYNQFLDKISITNELSLEEMSTYDIIITIDKKITNINKHCICINTQDIYGLNISYNYSLPHIQNDKINLHNYLYIFDKPDSTRHDILHKITNDHGSLKVIRHLAQVKNLQPKKHIKDIIEKDIIYLNNLNIFNQNRTDLFTNSIICGTVANEVLNISYNAPPLSSLKYQYFNKSLLDFNLLDTTVCIVGCGSIANEIINNLVKTQIQNIILIDNSKITEANVSTHTIFTMDNINQYKVDVLKQFMNSTSPSINVITYTNPLDSTTETLYDKQFYDAISCVIITVDNTESKTYISSRCTLFKIPHIVCDSVSFTGYTQVCVPHITNSFDPTNDPIKKEYPLCTIGLYPTNIEHCIIWSQEQLYDFFQIFKKCSQGQYDLSSDNDKMLSDIIKSNDHYTIANIMYNKYFVEQISELTTKFPIDYVLDDGTSFWANKQYPHLLDEVCTLKHDFIKEFVLVCGQVNDKRLKSLAKLAYYATSLRAQNYGIALIGEFAFYKIFCNIIPKLSSMGSIIAGLAL